MEKEEFESTKVKVRECPECNELSLIEDYENVNCFKLSDFKELAQGNDELILAEQIDNFNESYTIECNNCPHCDSLFEDFQEKEQELWASEFGEFFDTKEEAMGEDSP